MVTQPDLLIDAADLTGDANAPPTEGPILHTVANWDTSGAPVNQGRVLMEIIRLTARARCSLP